MAKKIKVSREEFDRLFDKEKLCNDCGGVHHRSCPRVASFEYHESGKIKSVTYHPPGGAWEEQVLYADDVELISEPDPNAPANGKSLLRRLLVQG